MHYYTLNYTHYPEFNDINSDTPDALNRVWRELEYCLGVCTATNGLMKLRDLSFFL